MLRPRTLPAGFIAPCLPTKAPRPPSGDIWLHEIKHDGFRVIARKDGPQVRLYGRPGNDLTDRFPLIVEAMAGLRSRSCIIDGEAVACDENGIASFDRIRHHRVDDSVLLYAFDLIELNGDDLRRDPMQVRKATLTSVVAKAVAGIRFNEHLESDGETVFRHACKLGLEGIVSKRKDSPYRSGRSPDWLKMKNPACAAVRREAEDLPARDVDLIRQWAFRTNSVREVWLFGSRAKGTARPDSDVDIGIYLMPPAGGADWALATYTEMGDWWQRDLATLLGRHASLEAMIAGSPNEKEVRRGVLLWTRPGT